MPSVIFLLVIHVLVQKVLVKTPTVQIKAWCTKIMTCRFQRKELDKTLG